MSNGPPFKLKPLKKSAIPRALEKAMRYRLLNEPVEAESICRDILAADAKHQEAIVLLLLSLTDQFGTGMARTVPKAKELLPQLEGEYRQTYYEGLICERQGSALIEKGGPGAHHAAFDWLRQAMNLYEVAETFSDKGDDEAILRWNTCARLIMDNGLEERVDDDPVQMLE